jgi:hypothetical protein
MPCSMSLDPSPYMTAGNPFNVYKRSVAVAHFSLVRQGGENEDGESLHAYRPNKYTGVTLTHTLKSQVATSTVPV